MPTIDLICPPLPPVGAVDYTRLSRYHSQLSTRELRDIIREAADQYLEAAEIYREMGDKLMLARQLGRVGESMSVHGFLREESIVHFEESAALYEELVHDPEALEAALGRPRMNGKVSPTHSMIINE